MDFFSIWHWLILGIVVILLFGRGKISDVMGDVAKGIKTFKKSMAEDDEPAPAAPRETERVKAIDPPHEDGAAPGEATRHTEHADG